MFSIEEWHYNIQLLLLSKCTVSLSMIPGEVIDVMLFCNSRVVLKSPIVVATVVRSETDAVAALLILVAIKVLSCSVLTVVRRSVCLFLTPAAGAVRVSTTYVYERIPVDSRYLFASSLLELRLHVRET